MMETEDRLNRRLRRFTDKLLSDSDKDEERNSFQENSSSHQMDIDTCFTIEDANDRRLGLKQY